MRLRALVVGLGPIGRATASALLDDPRFELAGTADPRPELAGSDLGVELGRGSVSAAGAALRIHASVGELLAGPPARVAFVTTSSRAEEVAAAAEPLLRAGLAVVSSCEELAVPESHPAPRDRLRRACRAGGAAFVATGVNPGFVMDLLPVVLASAVREVTAVRVLRVVDSLTRRPQLRAKTGAGLAPEEFRERAARGALGHVGLRESAALVARALGMPAAVVEALEPVLSAGPLATPEGPIAAGRVAGVRQTANVAAPGGGIRLELVIAAGASDPRDEVEVRGRRSLVATLAGGAPGEEATVARLLAAAPVLLRASPDVCTVLDLPPAPPASAA